MSRRVRWLTILGVAIAVVAMALLIAVYVVMRPERITAMLRSAARDAGLQLTLGAPAQPTLFPQPGLVLHGLQLTPIGSQMPMLIAARSRVELPWRVLLGSPPAITRLQLDAPRLDLAGLRQGLANLPSGGNGPVLPRIDVGISINGGSLISGNELLLDDITLHTGRLAPGQEFHLRLSARSPEHHPYTLNLGMTPHTGDNVIRFDKLTVHAQGRDAFALAMSGRASWHGGADMALMMNGTLRQQSGTEYKVSVALQPADATSPLMLKLKVDGGDTHADLALPPLALGNWWSRLAGEDSTAALAPPPLTGHAQVKQLDLGSVKIQGLQIDAGAPAAASSTSGNGASSKQP